LPIVGSFLPDKLEIRKNFSGESADTKQIKEISLPSKFTAILNNFSYELVVKSLPVNCSSCNKSITE
jgi:hypothetical protein